MRKLFKNIILLFFFSLVIGEVVVRFTHAVSDLPNRVIDDYGIQKYLPNQEGYWKGGGHKWKINTLGWPGELPKSYNNLILIIGDSFIENFMNPNECHQAAYLKEILPSYNFLEASRSGVSLIEAMEISRNMDSLKPIRELVYVNNNDFYESIKEVQSLKDITQLNLTIQTIEYGEMKAPGLKKLLYNWKLAYYFYNRFPLTSVIKKPKTSINNAVYEDKPKSRTEVFQLIDFIVDNYNISKKTLIFHPNSEIAIIEYCKQAGFDIFVLDSNNDETWTFDYDSHWTCYGHKRAAQQVSKKLSDSDI